MLTLCLGGPMDGQLTDQEYSDFQVRYADGDSIWRKERYRLEKFGWGTDWMWVYLHEFMSERVAMDTLFGTRAAERRGGG